MLDPKLTKIGGGDQDSRPEMFAEKLNIAGLKQSTLVPMPGSKIEGDPDYDDRMERVCRGIYPGLDVRVLVKQRIATRASHTSSGSRLTLRELLDALYIDEGLANPEPASICVFDDVVTKGTHFRAIHQVLSDRFPKTTILGVFIAIAVK